MLLNNRNTCFDFFYYSFYYLVTPIELHNIKNVLIKYRVYYPMWDLIFYFQFTHNVLYVPTIIIIQFLLPLIYNVSLLYWLDREGEVCFGTFACYVLVALRFYIWNLLCWLFWLIYMLFKIYLIVCQ
jgi:hypothetical protein